MKAVVVLSGGQDSTTCLYYAKQKYGVVSAVTFDYGQRHRREIDAAKEIAADAGVSHVVADIRSYALLSKSALTRSDIQVAAEGGLGGLPSTFTPGRNLVFLTMAASLAVSEGAHTVVTGVCQTDYSGYPDCRRDTMDALELAIARGNDLRRFTIDTPLMFLTKAQTVEMAVKLPGCMEAIAKTVTCYHGERPGCGRCPACELRKVGFLQAGVKDPAR